MQNQNVNPTGQAVYTQTQVNGQYYQNQGYPQAQNTAQYYQNQGCPQAQNAAQYYQNAVYQQITPEPSMMVPQNLFVKPKKKLPFSLAALICTIISGVMLLTSVIMALYMGSKGYELDRDFTKAFYERVEENDKEPYDSKKRKQKEDALDEKRKNARLGYSEYWEKIFISNQLRELSGILFLASAIWLIVSKKQASSDK